jgi:hypothetical protein
MKKSVLFDDYLDESDDILQNLATDGVASQLPSIKIISYCEVCKHKNVVKSPFIFTVPQMIERGWVEIETNVWAVGGTCSRSCEQKILKSNNL